MSLAARFDTSGSFCIRLWWRYRNIGLLFQSKDLRFSCRMWSCDFALNLLLNSLLSPSEGLGKRPPVCHAGKSVEHDALNTHTCPCKPVRKVSFGLFFLSIYQLRFIFYSPLRVLLSWRRSLCPQHTTIKLKQKHTSISSVSPMTLFWSDKLCQVHVRCVTVQ